MIMAEVSCSNDDDIDDNGNAMKITVVTAKTMELMTMMMILTIMTIMMMVLRSRYDHTTRSL